MQRRIAIDLNDVIRAYTAKFAGLYKKDIDNSFDIDNVDIFTNDLKQVFPFNSEKEYQDFVYVDYAYELFGCSEMMDKALVSKFNFWQLNDLMEMDVEAPELLFVSPFEFGLTIQSTFHFLSKFARVREVYFPSNSITIWDRCDILITANPRLIENKPEGKVSIKIEAPYNKDVYGDYNFKSFMDLMNDNTNLIQTIIQDLDKEGGEKE